MIQPNVEFAGFSSGFVVHKGLDIPPGSTKPLR